MQHRTESSSAPDPALGQPAREPVADWPARRAEHPRGDWPDEWRDRRARDERAALEERRRGASDGRAFQRPGPGPAMPAPPRPAPPERAEGSVWRVAAISAVLASLLSVMIAVPVTAALLGPATAPEAPEAPDADPPPAADPAPAPAPAPEPPPPGSAVDVAAVAEAVLPSVALVETDGGSGSAVVISEDGYLLTNAHVVRQAQNVTVSLPDGVSRPAEVVGTDPVTDVAVLRVDTEGGTLPLPAFAEDEPRIGQLAVAIGSPFGLEGTVTAGIVSGLSRDVPVGPFNLLDTIQTDAAINPGNSGGALVNDRAEVIGINTAIFSPTGTAAGVGFAIPIDTALSVAEQLITDGVVEHAQLGIVGENIDERIAAEYGLEEGALVRDVVPGSGAADAGLQPGDVIVALNGEAVTTMSELSSRIRAASPGDEVALTVVRGGQQLELQATLGVLQPPA